MKKVLVSIAVAFVAGVVTVNAEPMHRGNNHRHHDKVVVVENSPRHHERVRYVAEARPVHHRPAIGARYERLPEHAVKVVHRGHTYWRTPDGVIFDKIMTTAGIVYSVVHLLSY